MATQITNYQCPSCTGPLQFSATTGRLECEYCGSGYSVEEIEALYTEKNEKAEAAAVAGDWNAESMRAYICPSCGTELLCDRTTAATACPYCGNPSVVPGQFADVQKPDYVIPFAVDKEGAVAALKNHYKGKILLPGSFAKDSHLEEVKGVYVPFWLYDGDAEADVVFRATRSRVHTTPNERITTTEYYRVERGGTVAFEKVPVDGSTKMPDGHMDAIEPFDYEKMEPFSMAYLPGFLADKYDQDADTCAQRAQERCRNSAIAAMESTVTGYSGSTVEQANVQMHQGRVSYALLPVWMLSTRWQDKNYLFAMNGQTGKLVGDLPVSKGRLALLFAGVFAFLAVLGTALFELEAGLIGGAIFAAIVCLIMAGTMKTANVRTDANAYIPSSGVRLRHRMDVFTHRTVTRQPINRDSGAKGNNGR